MEWHHRRDTRRAGMAACLLATLLVAAPPSYADDGAADATDFLLATPQIEDPLRPLQHAGIAASRITVHAAVVGVADPLETHLGRAFDVQLSAIVRAFHARGYVLDGFALTWDPRLARNLRGGGSPPDGNTSAFRDGQRSRPSVLLFRLDEWRRPDATRGSRYVVLFLVGESPTFGLQREAFQKAAKCAAALNSLDPDAVRQQSMYSLQSVSCTDLFDRDVRKGGRWLLPVIGPSFSGSMESLALSLGEIFERARYGCEQQRYAPDAHCEPRSLEVEVTSPSASVNSNARVADWAKSLSGDAARIGYTSLAAALEDQLATLCAMPALQRKDQDGRLRRIVILAEESSFGRGVSELLTYSKALGDIKGCKDRIQVRMFPQNVAAIRAEQSSRQEQSNAGVSRLIPARSRLLPLDLTEVDESMDRPTAFHRKMSSRSDELMLYQTFDAMRVWADPAAVAIVATDVRDRLFLLNEVRKNLPTALPVLMEMDFLTAHPDYRSISRGSVVIPNAETLVPLQRDTGAVLAEHETRAAHASGVGVDYYSFPSDYAANMFRAVLALVDRFADTGHRPTVSDARVVTGPLVTTLAGFQKLPPPPPPEDATGPQAATRAGAIRSTLLAADSRLSLERPFYLMVLAAGLVLFCSAGWLLVFGRRHLVMVSALRNLDPRNGVKERTNPGSAQPTHHEASSAAQSALAGIPAPSQPARLAASALLGLLGAVLVAIGSVRLVSAFVAETRELTWPLAHGRDAWALASLGLLYLAIAITGRWRLWLWQQRYDHFRSRHRVADPAFEGHDASTREGHNAVALPAALLVLVVMLMPVFSRGLATSVDSPWYSLWMSLLLLPAGAWFLGQFLTQSRHWSQLALALGGTMTLVSARTTANGAKPSDEDGWPSPVALGELPQSPYSLQFRGRDLLALGVPSDDAKWEHDTRRLRSGEWPFPDGRSPAFLEWQARLVAEMRYAAVAVRTAAWCGILAPTAVLIGLNVFPPYDQRLQTTVAVSMIIAGFLLVMYQALRLERHPLLSRMFTLHGDKLSLGSALGTLWPKLIAASVILVPVLFPDFQTWLHGLIRSINSLQ